MAYPHTLVMQKIPVFVISRVSARERRASIQRQFDALGIDFEFVDGVEGAAITAQRLCELNPRRNLSPSAVGCYLSHIEAYRRIVDRRLAVALVLEDDTRLHRAVKPLLESGLASLDFDYCFLCPDDIGDHGFVYYDAHSRIPLSDTRSSFRLSSGPYCLNAAFITQEGALKRLAQALPIRFAVDNYSFLPYRPRFRGIFPPLAFMSEHHALDSMSAQQWTPSEKRIHRYPIFYAVRDLLKLKWLKKQIALRKVKAGDPGAWVAYRSAVRVVE